MSKEKLKKVLEAAYTSIIEETGAIIDKMDIENTIKIEGDDIELFGLCGYSLSIIQSIDNLVKMIDAPSSHG